MVVGGARRLKSWRALNPFSMEFAVLGLGIIIIVAYLLEDLYLRFRIPDVFILILIGVILGPLTRWLPSESLGHAHLVVAKIALVLLLFREGLELQGRVLWESFRQATVLALVGFPVYAAVGGLLAWLFFPSLTVMEIVLLGTMLGATSAVVVIPMLKGLNVSDRLTYTAVLESTVADVLAIVVTLALLETYHIKGFLVGKLIGTILYSFVMAGLLAVVAGWLWMLFSTKLTFFPTTTLSLAAYLFVVFGVAEFLGYSGAVAALVLGIVLGNSDALTRQLRKIPYPSALRVSPFEMNDLRRKILEEMVFLIKVFFFVLLGISMDVLTVEALWYGLAVSGSLLVIRWFIVRFVLPRSFSWQEGAVLACLIPRGVVPAVLSLWVLEEGLAGGSLIQKGAYSTILISIALTALLILLMERPGLRRAFVHLYLRFPGGKGRSLVAGREQDQVVALEGASGGGTSAGSESGEATDIGREHSTGSS